MKITIRYLLVLTLIMAGLIVIAPRVRRYLYPPASPNAIQLLDTLNDWDADESYLYNNPELAAQSLFHVSGESYAYITLYLEQLDEIEHPVRWNNRTRKYEFKNNTLE